jgi:hypothetical protein
MAQLGHADALCVKELAGRREVRQYTARELQEKEVEITDLHIPLFGIGGMP